MTDFIGEQARADFIELHDLKCGFCEEFPGDGKQCEKTLDIVSYDVKACEKWKGEL